jgi:S1-C subfamily serine protease
MFGIRDSCPRCGVAMLRFPGGVPRIVSCPSCHAVLEVSDRGIGPVVTNPASRRAPVQDVGKRARVGGDKEKGGTPVASGDVEAGTTIGPWRWALFVGVPVGVALGLAAIIVVLRARPASVARAVTTNTLDSLPTTSGSFGATVSHVSTNRDGESSLAKQRHDQVEDASSTKAPMSPMLAARSDRIPASLAEVVRQVAPSVATIFVKETDSEGLGSGFIVLSSRLMVTNYHVVERASQAVAIQRRPDGSEGIRRVVQGFVACDPRADLVLLALAEDWPGKPLPLAPATTAPGTSVFAVGSPHGLVGTVTRGIVSGMRKAGELDSDDLAPRTALVQTDAFFSRGSSGGPLCDEQGRVVGITAFGVTFRDGVRSSDNDVFRFAIAAEEVGGLIQRRAPKVRPLSQLPRSGK